MKRWCGSESQEELPVPDLEIMKTDDLEFFSSTIKEIFSLPEEFTRYFTKKMAYLRQLVPATFYLAHHNGKASGCWTMFQTASDTDFMMNFGLRPEFRGKGLSAQLVNAVINSGRTVIYTHTNSEILANTLLPKAGFTNLGKLVVSTLDDYLKAVKAQ